SMRSPSLRGTHPPCCRRNVTASPAIPDELPKRSERLEGEYLHFELQSPRQLRFFLQLGHNNVLDLKCDSAPSRERGRTHVYALRRAQSDAAGMRIRLRP